MNTGTAPNSAAGVTKRRRSSAHVGQDSMWRLMRLRISTLKVPSQPASMSRSSVHALAVCLARRATSSAPSEVWMVSRSRDTILLALPGLTSNASASSGPSKPWR